MTLTIKDAVKERLKARIGLLAPTGGGKTFTGLKFLFSMVEIGMAKKVGVIDTEHRSASKYLGDPFPLFRVIELEEDFSPEVYVEAIKLMAEDGVDALMIDSLTHAWAGKGGALEIKDKVGRQKGYNDYTAWGPVSAMHNRLIEAMLSYPGHLVATMRLKMEHVLEEDPATKKKTVRKIGLQPVQRDGMEYEFDLVGDLDQDHHFTISKTRCRTLDGYAERKPGKDVIVKMRAWLEGGAAQVDRDQARTFAAATQSSPPSAPAPTAIPPTPLAPEAGKEAPPAQTFALYADQLRGAATQQALDAIAAAVAGAVASGKVTATERGQLLKLYEERAAALEQSEKAIAERAAAERAA